MAQHLPFDPPIPMVDLVGQHARIQSELDEALLRASHQAHYIQGPDVAAFAGELSAYLGEGVHTIPCANGTDALQIALMALGLQPGDEVITATFTYVATAEVIALLGLTPVLVDVEPGTFSLDLDQVRAAVTPRTKAIVPVHLYGQGADMDALLALANERGIPVVEDTAQALGARYTLRDGRTLALGTLGTVAARAFFRRKTWVAWATVGRYLPATPRLRNESAWSPTTAKKSSTATTWWAATAAWTRCRPRCFA